MGGQALLAPAHRVFPQEIAAPPPCLAPQPAMETQLECGTTCSLALVQGEHVCIANVGDSTVVLGRCTRNRGRCKDAAAPTARHARDRRRPATS